jgi:glycosyltransferase involved in cell wall biosynthesis
MLILSVSVEKTEMDNVRSLPRFVLITPARNEEEHIGKLIQSVTSQTILPLKWVIVNDGSTDTTANIVSSYLAEHEWIELLNLPSHRDRSFAAKVFAVNAGLERVKNLDFEVVGNLDSDVSFDTEYFEFLMKKFQENPHLGVAGTIFQEEGYSSGKDSFEGQNHVAGGCQLFRRRCFEHIGGYIPNKAGGIDWIAVTTARMKGWKTRSYREKSFFHYRSLGTAERSLLASAFSYGEKDYYLGGHPLWEVFRVAYRITKKPYLLGGIALFSGYAWAFFRRTERPVSDELMRFHREEQLKKLKAILRSLVTFKKIDSFEVKPR